MHFIYIIRSTFILVISQADIDVQNNRSKVPPRQDTNSLKGTKFIVCNLVFVTNIADIRSLDFKQQSINCFDLLPSLCSPTFLCFVLMLIFVLFTHTFVVYTCDCLSFDSLLSFSHCIICPDYLIWCLQTILGARVAQ